MPDVADNTPVLVGAGQTVYRGSIDEHRFSPADLVAQAAQSALRDAGLGSANGIDTLVVTRLFQDSSPYIPSPFGRCENLPAALAHRLQLVPSSLIYTDVGGQSPQRLINEMARDIQQGRRRAVLLAGGEAMDLAKQAQRTGIALDWAEAMMPEYAHVHYDDRGYGKPFTGRREHPNGINSPTLAYALIENAWRAQRGSTIAEHRKLMADLFSRFSEVAATNPFAQFPEGKSSAFLAEESPENFAVTLPYTKWLVAQDAVNQGAAVLLTSVAAAREMGIDDARWVFLHGSGDADDALLTLRDSLSGAGALQIAATRALAMAGCTVDDMALLDLYSCFPCAVLTACEALGIDWGEDARPLTVTGGLPYFGGPGNNYSMHAIAEMMQRLRVRRGDHGLVWANGGYLSKASVGIYSTAPPASGTVYGCDIQQTEAAQHPAEELVLPSPQPAVVESFTVSFKRGEPVFACVVAATENGAGRLAAKLPSAQKQTLATLAVEDIVGRRVTIESADNANYFTLIG